jgi:transposase
MVERDKEMNKYTIKDFDKEFPTDEVCMEWLKNHRYPDGINCPVCDKVTKHHRVAKRACYECDNCGHQIYPLAGTIFNKSATSLRTWFQVIYRMASTRCGISAKQIQRETGVTYKTAWRMFKQIRTLLGENTYHLAEVEMDETYVGGKAINMHASKRAKLTGRGTADKTAVFGIVERKGRVSAVVVPSTDRSTLITEVENRVMKPATVYTDEMSAYEPLTYKGYNHQAVNHSDKVYVKGNAHTNTIEGFWSLVKRGISGVYHAVSPKYLQSYVNEYSFRYNHRKDETPMFKNFLSRIS